MIHMVSQILSWFMLRFGSMMIHLLVAILLPINLFTKYGSYSTKVEPLVDPMLVSPGSCSCFSWRRVILLLTTELGACTNKNFLMPD